MEQVVQPDRSARERRGPQLTVALFLLALLLVYSFALATHFTFRFEPLRFMDQYNYLANGLAHFHFYGCDAAGKPLPMGCMDCINYHGKAYYPYGPVPALVQVVLVNLLGFPVASGAVVWAVCALTLCAAFWLALFYARDILGLAPKRAILCAAAFTAVAGTTDMFLHTSTVPYSWSQSGAAGALFNLLFAYVLLRSLHRQSATGLVWAGALCGLSFLCKQNYLPAFLAGCALVVGVAWRDRWPRRNMAAQLSRFMLPVFLSGAALLWYNHARFGSPFETGFPYLNASEKAPLRYQMPQPHRAPYNFYNHFLAGFEVRTSDFPLVLGHTSNFGGINFRDGSGGLLHNYPIVSAFVAMPMLLLLIPAVLYPVNELLMVRRLARNWDYFLFLIALWGCGFVYFLNESGSFKRYQFDMPFLLGLAVLHIVVTGWRAAARIPRPATRAVLRACAAAFLIACFVEQAAIGLDQTAGLFLTRDDKFIHWSAAERDSDRALQQRAHAALARLFARPPDAAARRALATR